MTPEKRIKLLRSYLRQPGFKGVWLGRKEIEELLAYIYYPQVTNNATPFDHS